MESQGSANRFAELAEIMVSGHEEAFREKVTDYWDARSDTYSNSIKDELRDFHLDAWSDALMARIPTGKRFAASSELRVLDLGCGPGFFEIILSRNGCKVDAVDGSQAMLEQAQKNVLANGNPTLVDFHCCDATDLPFFASSYDVVISRNVTWLMPDPVKAYQEWHRVLKPGGKLLVFDANWYAYLVDESLNRMRLNDQADASILQWDAHSFATSDQERRCESIALRLPLTYQRRPAWDASVLPSLGFDDVQTEENFSRRVWNKGEQAFYATSPLFAIEAVKTAWPTFETQVSLS